MVCRQEQNEVRSHPFDTTVDYLGHVAKVLVPAEGLPRSVTVFGGQGITFLAGGASVDGGILKFLGDMRGACDLPEVREKLGGVTTFVRS